MGLDIKQLLSVAKSYASPIVADLIDEKIDEAWEEAKKDPKAWNDIAVFVGAVVTQQPPKEFADQPDPMKALHARVRANVEATEEWADDGVMVLVELVTGF